MEIAFRFHSIEADGPWTSPPFPPAERRHIVQGVIGGAIMGRPRWAEDMEGNFIYGLDATGKEMKSAPRESHVITGEITDEQIRALRDVLVSDRVALVVLSYDEMVQLNSAQYQCSVALGERRARRGWSRAKARARCAEILKARGAK